MPRVHLSRRLRAWLLGASAPAFFLAVTFSNVESEVLAKDCSPARDAGMIGAPSRTEGAAVGIPKQEARSDTPVPRRIQGKDGAPMVLVPSGVFLMGSDPGEIERLLELEHDLRPDSYANESPRHRVALRAFYMDAYEVTNELFDRFRRAEYGVKGGSVTERPNLPVVAVSWHEAEAYCRWVGKRLPTETEWEYAARAGTETAYWWGNGSPGSRLVGNVADASLRGALPHRVVMSGYDDGFVKEAPVGSFEPNPWNLYDLLGNVWEWTADWYDPHYYRRSPEQDPVGPDKGEVKVVRGGSWASRPSDTRCAVRVACPPSGEGRDVGFRCVQDLAEEEGKEGVGR